VAKKKHYEEQLIKYKRDAKVLWKTRPSKFPAITVKFPHFCFLSRIMHEVTFFPHFSNLLVEVSSCGAITKILIIIINSIINKVVLK
jgi:hypothetical protein